MKYKVVLFVFLKITICCTISSASTDINRPKKPEFIKHLLIEGQKVDHDQNISLWSRNENSRLRSAIKIGKICLEDRDCKWNDNNELICIFRDMNKKIGKCGCPERSKFNRNTLSCTIQRYKRNYPGCTDCHNANEFFLNGTCVPGIGAKCPEGSECPAKNSKCEHGICQCLSGYESVNQSYCELKQCKEDYDVCDPNLYFPCCSDDMQCINVNPELQNPRYKCVKENFLGDSCDNNLDCMGINHAKCAEDRTCICKNFALEYDNVCLDKLYSEKLAPKYENLFQYDGNINRYKRMDDKITLTDFSKKSDTIYGEWCSTAKGCQFEDYRNVICHKFVKDSSMNFCTCPTGTNYDYVKKTCTEERHSELIKIEKQKYYERNHIQISGKWYSIYLGNCSTNTDCEKLTNGVCEDKNCVCKKNWELINETFCEFPIDKIHTRCEFNNLSCRNKEDCFLENSICNNTFCDCGEEDYYQNGQCISRKYGVGSPCECEKLCTGLKYGVCRNDKCECEKNYVAKIGRCAGKHGQSCDDSDDCFADNAMCRNKTCDCKDSFFRSGDHCVIGAITLGSKCSLEETCRSIKYSECKDGTCQCKNGYEKLNNECRALIKKPCDVRGDCYAENADCIEKKCSCGNDYYYLEKNCHEMTRALNDSCLRDEACQKIKNSKCKDGKCQCLYNYKERDGNCLGLDQAPCKIPKNCFAKNASCKNKKCSCLDRFYYEDDHCYKKAIRIGDACHSQIACEEIKNTECKSGKCQCLSNYKEKNGNCLGLHQASCETSKDCFSKNATCKNKKCDCLDPFYYEDYHCYKKAKGIGDACLSQIACKEIKNTECKDGKCQCLSNYKIKDGNCLGLDQAPCEIPEDCFAKNATCKSKKCECPDRFHYEDEHCYENDKLPDNACGTSGTCKKKNTECKNEKCQCLPNYKEMDGNCLGLHQASCETSKDCFSKNATCKNKKCDCLDPFYYEDYHCYKKAQGIGDACLSQIACKEIKNTECKDGKCQCLSNYKIKDGNCLGLDQAPCEIPDDCFAKNATCKSKKCECPDRFHYEDEHCYENDKRT
ncbi:uncharacterized protein ZC84.1-like [Cotesia glomerata]|uniref:uncharacterized protein ZC84.1-like n=1 Tax=Cotesia glomerata TaxID=32391 RepID=UPI001D02C333|nr:uncharacterized protein ZC84.1-like [Cotesia glomerata]